MRGKGTQIMKTRLAGPLLDAGGKLGGARCGRSRRTGRRAVRPPVGRRAAINAKRAVTAGD
jgi:hypothetical protein